MEHTVAAREKKRDKEREKERDKEEQRDREGGGWDFYLTYAPLEQSCFPQPGKLRGCCNFTGSALLEKGDEITVPAKQLFGNVCVGLQAAYCCGALWERKYIWGAD